jgi:hypothetical protein
MTGLARGLAIAVACIGLVSVASVASADKLKPSSAVKAYKGAEGEVIAVVEVNDSKEMLVHFRGVGSDLDGKTQLWLFEDRGGDRKEVYRMKKRGSKTYRAYILTEYERGSWLFINPNKNQSYRVYYSEAESKKIKVDEVVAAYQP